MLPLPWSFSSDLAHQGGLAACSWPGQRWAVSHMCCSTATGRLQLHDPEAPGVESQTERFPRRGGAGWVLRGPCSCLAGEPGVFSSTGLFSCPHGSCRFIACRLPLSSTSPQRGGSVSQHIWSQEHPWPWGTGRQGDPSIAIPSEVCFHEHNTGPSIGWHWHPLMGSGLSLLCPKPPRDPTKVPSVG